MIKVAAKTWWGPVPMPIGMPTFSTQEKMVSMEKLEPNIPGTQCMYNVCMNQIYQGPNVHGDQMSRGPFVPGYLISWGPFVLGDLFWGPNFQGRIVFMTKYVTANFQGFIRITLDTTDRN